MQTDPEEFRRRFEDRSDEALLEVHRDELVEVAQELYDAELPTAGLDRRGAARRARARPKANPDDPKDDLVLAAEFGSAQELAFARSFLKSASIPTYIETDFSGILGTTEADTKLYVPSAYLEQAQELLNTSLTDEELAEQAEAAGEESVEEEEEEAAADEEEEEDEHEDERAACRVIGRIACDGQTGRYNWPWPSTGSRLSSAFRWP